MGLFKTENHTHTHTHVSEDAAKQMRKGSEALAEAQKAAKSAAYSAERTAELELKAEKVKLKAVEEQERTKRYAVDQGVKSEAMEKLWELAETGTYAAYVRLVACRETEEGFFSLGLNLKDNAGPKPSEKDLATVILGFNYTKDINELDRIVKYAIQKCLNDDLLHIQSVIQTRAGEPEYERLAEEIDKHLNPTLGNIFDEVKKNFSKVFGVFSMKKR